MIVIRQINSGCVEVEIPTEHVALGRDWCMAYAERLARAAFLEQCWRGTMVTVDTDKDTGVVRLKRVRPV